MPGAGTTTINAAMLEGIVASNPNISGNYSGGVENFLRLLENWSGDTLTYNGSIVVLFYSQYATNSWQPTGNYYNPPTRKWAFDLNFDNALKIPPLTPDSKAMIRGNWYAHQYYPNALDGDRLFQNGIGNVGRLWHNRQTSLSLVTLRPHR